MAAPRACVPQIELEEGDSSSLVKQRLQAATGVPATDMKIRLGGYNQMVMIDTASNIRVGTSGITKGALAAAQPCRAPRRRWRASDVRLLPFAVCARSRARG